MNRLESVNSEYSEGTSFMYAHGAAYVHREIQKAREAPTDRRPAGQLFGAHQPAAASTGTKRRRATVVKRNLGSTFDSVEGVHDTMKTPHPLACLAPGTRPRSVLASREFECSSGEGVADEHHGRAHGADRRANMKHGVTNKTTVVSSEDVSNGSAFTVEQSTSLTVDSRSGNRRGASGSAPRESLDSQLLLQYVPLLELLKDTDRGSRLTLPETKALVYSLAEDLYEIHEGRAVHTNLCLESTTLGIVDGTGRASLLRKEGDRSFVWPAAEVAAGKVPVSMCSHTMPPEMAPCRPCMINRVLTKKGNMWSLGCVMFSLLAGGRDPFGEHGVGVCGGETLLLSVDRQQSWLSAHVSDKMRRINENKIAGLASDGSADAYGANNRVFVAAGGVVGFDSLASDLLSCLLRVDPGQRFTAKDVLNHPWFDGVRQCLPQGSRTGPCSRRGTEDSGLGNMRRSLGSENERSLSEDQEQSYRSDLKYSQLHQKYIFIDPSILSPMHPYTLVGHVKKEIEFESLGEAYAGIGVFAVYNVPQHGTMMSAKPIQIMPH